MKDLIIKHLNEHKNLLDKFDELNESIEKIANLLICCLESEGTIYWCGNGGSASDSQHLAAEFVGRYVNDRRPLKSIALNADSAVMTCIVNDYGYDQIFSRQVEALGTEKDVLIGISTSGNSKNVLNALDFANKKNMVTIGLLGNKGGKAGNIAQHSIIVPSKITARIQEIHILIGHILCDLVEVGLNLKK